MINIIIRVLLLLALLTGVSMSNTMTKLPIELTYIRQGKLIMPFFLPALGISKKMKDHEIERFAELIAKRKVGNAIRLFSAGCWEPRTIPNMIMPFVKDGKFDLTKPNPLHIQTLKRRIQYFTDRRITVILTVIDNTSTHVNRPGFWNEHWMNGKNNVNNTRWEKQSIYHYYEHPDRPEAVNTGKFQEAYVRYLVGELDYNSPYIIYEICNEGQAGFKWHRIYGKLFRELGVSRKRRLTSLDMYWFYRKFINFYFMYSKHSIANLDDFEDSKKYFRPFTKWLPSGDGKPMANPNILKDMVYQLLKKGHLGYERNTHGTWNNLDWVGARAMRRGWRKWMEDK